MGERAVKKNMWIKLWAKSTHVWEGGEGVPAHSLIQLSFLPRQMFRKTVNTEVTVTLRTRVLTTVFCSVRHV